MAEKIKAKLIVVGIDETSDEVKDLATAKSASWKEMPLTYREDELTISEDEPTKNETYSHELDSAVDVDYDFKGVVAKGSFIMPDVAKVSDLIGGTVSGTAYQMGSTHALINKSLRFRFKQGGYVVLPNASGYALLNMGVGRNGVVKFPFQLDALSKGNVPPLIWETKETATPATRASYPTDDEE